MKIGVTKHIIYRRYASKLALLDAFASRELARLDGDVQTPAGSDPQPLTDLKGAARSFFNLCLTLENRAFIKFISAESAFNPDIGNMIVKWDGIVIAAMMKWIQKDIDAELIAAEALFACNALTGLLDANRRLAFHDPYDGLSSEDWFEARWAVFEKAFINRGSGTTSLRRGRA